MIVKYPTEIKTGYTKSGMYISKDTLQYISKIPYDTDIICGKFAKIGDDVDSSVLDDISNKISENPDCYLVKLEVENDRLFAYFDFIDDNKAIVLEGGKFKIRILFEFVIIENIPQIAGIKAVLIERM